MSQGALDHKEVGNVKHQFRTWRTGVRVLALALVLSAIPLPGLAEESSKPAPVPGLKASIAKAAASGSVALEQAKPAAPDKAQLGSSSFFRKPAGMIVLAVVAAGTGYAMYSASHDRIHSVIRQNQ